MSCVYDSRPLLRVRTSALRRPGRMRCQHPPGDYRTPFIFREIFRDEPTIRKKCPHERLHLRRKEWHPSKNTPVKLHISLELLPNQSDECA